MSTTTDSQNGAGFDNETKEFAHPYDPTWGLVLHSEVLQIEKSKVDNDYRTRGFTHTLNITGVHLRSYLIGEAEPRIINIKDKLHSYFYGTKVTELNSVLSPALFPSIVQGEGAIEWEPIALNIAEGTYVDELRYTASLVYRRHPKDSDIQTISLFGKQFWDGSDVSYRRSYDRTSKKITQITALNATISCPNDMSWTKALYFFDQANSLQVTAVTSNKDITEVEASKNYDKQTVSYNISGYDILDKGDDGGILNLFGHDWPATSEVSIETTPLYDTHINGVDAALQNIGLSVSISSPDDMEFTDAMKHYQYAVSMIPKKYYPTFGDAKYKYGRNESWEIETISYTFNPSKKTVTISIRGKRVIRRKSISKILSLVVGGQPFLWTGTKVEYSYGSEVEGLIFSEGLNVNGSAQIPNDMTEAEANIIVQDITRLKLFDSVKYPGYKLGSKSARYDKFEKRLEFNFDLKKIDFYDPFYVSGSTARYRNPNDNDRKVKFSYGVLSSISGIQFEVEYKEDYSRTEDESKSFSFSVNGRLRTLLNESTGKPIGKSVESILDDIWERYVDKDIRLTAKHTKYICNQCSRSISTNAMEGVFSLTFTDFGKQDRKAGFYFPENMGNAGLLVIGEFDEDASIMQFGTSSDGFSNGLLYQENGISIRTISLNVTVHKSEFKNGRYRQKWARIVDRVNSDGGYLTVRGVKGRVKRLSISGINLANKTAKISAVIEVQPDIKGSLDPRLIEI